MKKQLVLSLATIGFVASALQAQGQHGHINAGAAGTNQNDPVIWANAADFVDASGYVKTLDFTNGGRFAGYYQGGITPTALPATPAHGGPDPVAAALGANLRFRLSCLEAPPGGLFGFWDTGSTSPSASLGGGEASSNLWRLSETDGSPSADPYGHIHGRRFSATKPGIYKVGFTAVDISTNGTGGGPIHTPSTELPVWFQAGVNIREILFDDQGRRVSFGAAGGMMWRLEMSSSPAPGGGWTEVGTPITGDDYFRELEDTGPAGESRFYRLLGTPIAP